MREIIFCSFSFILSDHHKCCIDDCVLKFHLSSLNRYKMTLEFVEEEKQKCLKVTTNPYLFLCGVGNELHSLSSYHIGSFIKIL